MAVSFLLFFLVSAGIVGLRWRSGQRGVLQPGKTTQGHYQIELSCESCHTPFSGVSQEACVRCHGEELDRVDDSHPATKFLDPRNADRLEHLDALRCVTCHVEHQPERTLAMGLTQPADVCRHCHSDIATERVSHRGLPFDGCASPGCHNFHDNLALNSDFMQKHLDDPDFVAGGSLPAPMAVESKGPALTMRDADAPPGKGAQSNVGDQWADSTHAVARVNCSECHGAADSWVEHPAHTVCAECHEGEVTGFLSGLHGMRLMPGLSPVLDAMTPGDARLPMRREAAHEQLGCQSCHQAHDYDRVRASVEACLGCHASQHSLSYRASPHFRLLQAERAGSEAVGRGVSCASCHLPRDQHGAVQHNQSDNLRPNEKMVRGVCLACHGLQFSLDALADGELVRNNFRGRPARRGKSLEMIRRQLADRANNPAAAQP